MKTPPILLKLLHNSAAKASPKFNKTASKKGDGGFTLLEVLVIVLLIGIFSSIAAPSWQGFINRQRVRTVNDRVLQSLRLAQSEAKRTKSDRVVTLNPLVDPPTATIKTEPAQNPPLQTVTFDAGGEIKPGQVKLSVASCPPNSACTAATQLTFNYNGIVDPSNSNNPTLPFVVTVSTVNGGAKQCAIVETLLGGMRTAEGNDCRTLP
ncbi:prepilin-type N-terminal cleavage/methylation domain-containing protein [Microcoleus sp. T3_A4]|uniref:prepilin-type N-terminal cleavage/methylation domain-containing protein n=1 Tax=Microcoleus sp. T3_A4 TaxID=2818968 RepID=UPI002FD5CE4C